MRKTYLQAAQKWLPIMTYIHPPLFKDALLRKKNKDGFTRNQDNVPNWSKMSTRELFFQ